MWTYKEEKFQMKWNQKISKTIIKMAWPAMLEQLLICMATLADTAMVGSLGAVSTAAVAVNISLVWVANGLITALSAGFSYMIAYSVGKNDKEETQSLVTQSITCSALVGLCLFITIQCLYQRLPVWMGAADDVVPYAREYLHIIGYGMIPQTIAVVLSADYRSAGNTRLPLVLNIISNLINIVGNIIFIYPQRSILIGGVSVNIWRAGMGVKGAAIATALSQLLLALMMIISLRAANSTFSISLLKGNYMASRKALTTLKRISIPVLLERWTLSMGQVVLTTMISSLGTVALSAHYLTNQIEGILYMPAYGMSYTATALIGQALGAGKKDLADSYMKYICLLGIIFIELFCIPVAIFSNGIMNCFSSDGDVVSLGTLTLLIAAATEIFFSFFVIACGIFRGAGDVKFSFIVSVVGMWGMRISAVWFAIHVLHLEIVSIWIVIGFDCLVRTCLCILRLKSKRWLVQAT